MNKKKSKQILRIFLLVGTVVSMFFVPWLLVKAWVLPLPDSLQAQADEAIDHGFDGIVVYIDKGGETPKTYTSGWHDREKKIPAKPTALFKIASIGKLYNAVAIAKLVKSDRLSLDKTVADYFPEFADRIEYADKITLKHLVQHKSGIPNYSNHPGYWGNPTKTDQETMELILDLPANFKPGEDYEYCNTNYLLNRLLIEKELGYSIFQFITEEILTPLNLSNTFENLWAVNMDEVMSGYHVGYGEDLKSGEWGMLATAQDVASFVRALNDGSVFKEGEQEIYASIYEYKHSGWVPGYQSFAEYHKDIDAVVVEFYNTTDDKLFMWNAAEIVNSRILKIISK
ncbi:serine hydrolase domain-containing protein [Urechidicola vernalis]|uniref:Serine hydrolase domain-containing protein n=1 Tax=Urechidicola vernalis TaxID=3075600 RepID=A0ABU2Y6W6_9FLAO|nr:serine hydrolase domain-containing protein [Urechidicola sp. P050]MDT0553941.1 serine hydrolase domain-containing protein [Urechidicola sp. P050]